MLCLNQTIGYCILLIFWGVYWAWHNRSSKLSFTGNEHINYSVLSNDEEDEEENQVSKQPVTLNKRILIAAACLKPIGLACGYTWYLSLPLTTVAANTGYYCSL